MTGKPEELAIRWCLRCEVGSLLQACWICGGETTTTNPYVMAMIRHCKLTTIQARMVEVR